MREITTVSSVNLKDVDPRCIHGETLPSKALRASRGEGETRIGEALLINNRMCAKSGRASKFQIFILFLLKSHFSLNFILLDKY